MPGWTVLGRQLVLATALALPVAAVVPGAAAGVTTATVALPSPRTLSQPIRTTSGTAIGTFSMTMTPYVSDVVGTVAPVQVQLPAGTYRLQSCATALLAGSFSGTPCPQTTQVTLKNPGTVTLPRSSVVATRSLTGQSNALAGWDKVMVLRSGVWTQYAISWQGLAGSSIAIPDRDPAAAATSPAAGVTPQTLSQPIATGDGTALGTFTMTMTTRATDVVAAIAPTTVHLPAGTYRLQSCAAALPNGTFSASPCPQTTEVTLLTAGSATLPPASVIASRSLTGATNAVVGWDKVMVLRDGAWSQYAISWRGVAGSNIPVPPVGAANTSQLYGSNSQVVRPNGAGGFAVVDDATATAELDALAGHGAQVVRTNLSWALLQPQKGQWDPTVVAAFDHYFATAHRLGLTTVVTVGTTPCWASSAPSTVKNGCASSLNGAGYPPASYTDRTAALTWMMKRWGYAVHGVEPWNEPNHAPNPDPCSNSTWGASTYVALLRNTYTAVKAVNPAIEVGTGTLSFADTTYLDCLYDAGMKGYYDAVDVHPYQLDFERSPATTGDPQQPFPLTDPAMDSLSTGMEDLRTDMLAHGDTAPVWVTETGFSTCQASGDPLCVTESQQAQWLRESFQVLARFDYVALALSYNAGDVTADTTNWNGNFGLLRHDLTAKPALAALGEAWACLHAGTC